MSNNDRAIQALEFFESDLKLWEDLNLRAVADAHTATSTLIAYARLEAIRSTIERVRAIIKGLKHEQD